MSLFLEMYTEVCWGGMFCLQLWDNSAKLVIILHLYAGKANGKMLIVELLTLSIGVVLLNLSGYCTILSHILCIGKFL